MPANTVSTMRPAGVVVSIWYLFLVSILSVLQQWVERRLARGHADGAGARLARRGMMR